jgi:hypothetical protein
MSGHFRPPGGVWPDDPQNPAWLAHRAAMVAAHEKASEYTRLYTRHGLVAHLSPPGGALGVMHGVLCSVLPKWPDDWLGTGSQKEYELAADMDTCQRCRDRFTASVECGNPECGCHDSLMRGAA